ncbi:MAG: inorganic diphosphatase [Acidobacteria bacterium]|nr:inorganic diphosphatase [Acidobacteriota bacterium]
MSPPLESLPALGAEGAVHVVIETPRGSASKFRYDTELGAITLSRPLPAGMTYPADWGFVPSTLAADGDPLDALVIWEGTSYPGVVLQCRVIGALEVEQANATTRARERNDRLIAVPLGSVTMQSVGSVHDLTERTRAELEHFFAAAVTFEHKDLKILGWLGPDEAARLLRMATTQRAPSPV